MHPDGQHPRHSLRQRPVKSNSSLLLPCLVSMFLLSLLLLPSLVLGSSNETNSQPDVIQDRKGSILDHAIESVATQTASLIKSLKERRLANRKSIGLELLSPDEFTQFFSVLRGNSHKEKTTGQTKPISPMDSQTTAASGKPHRPQRQQQHLPPQSSGRDAGCGAWCSVTVAHSNSFGSESRTRTTALPFNPDSAYTDTSAPPDDDYDDREVRFILPEVRYNSHRQHAPSSENIESRSVGRNGGKVPAFQRPRHVTYAAHDEEEEESAPQASQVPPMTRLVPTSPGHGHELLEQSVPQQQPLDEEQQEAEEEELPSVTVKGKPEYVTSDLEKERQALKKKRPIIKAKHPLLKHFPKLFSYLNDEEALDQVKDEPEDSKKKKKEPVLLLPQVPPPQPPIQPLVHADQVQGPQVPQMLDGQEGEDEEQTAVLLHPGAYDVRRPVLPIYPPQMPPLMPLPHLPHVPHAQVHHHHHPHPNQLQQVYPHPHLLHHPYPHPVRPGVIPQQEEQSMPDDEFAFDGIPDHHYTPQLSSPRPLLVPSLRLGLRLAMPLRPGKVPTSMLNAVPEPDYKNFDPLPRKMGSKVADRFYSSNIVQDMGLVYAPKSVLEVKFPNGAVLCLGNQLSVIDSFYEPKFNWRPVRASVQPNRAVGHRGLKNVAYQPLYTVIVLDPDLPLMDGQYVHLMRINIPAPGKKGTAIVTYINPLPVLPALGTIASPNHRYVFLVFAQTRPLNAHQVKEFVAERTQSFRIRHFVKKFGLEAQPVAGNFFYGRLYVKTKIIC